MTNTTDYIDRIIGGVMGQSPSRINLSIATQTTVNAPCSHNYANHYTYNIISYMICTYLCIVIAYDTWLITVIHFVV